MIKLVANVLYTIIQPFLPAIPAITGAFLLRDFSHHYVVIALVTAILSWAAFRYLFREGIVFKHTRCELTVYGNGDKAEYDRYVEAYATVNGIRTIPGECELEDGWTPINIIPTNVDTSAIHAILDSKKKGRFVVISDESFERHKVFEYTINTIYSGDGKKVKPFNRIHIKRRTQRVTLILKLPDTAPIRGTVKFVIRDTDDTTKDPIDSWDIKPRGSTINSGESLGDVSKYYVYEHTVLLPRWGYYYSIEYHWAV